MANILITGASGTVGTATIDALLELGGDHLIRGASRAPETLTTRYGNRVEAVDFDFATSATFAKVTAGVDAVLLIVPPLQPNVVELAGAFIDYLATVPQLHLVHLSAYGAERLPALAPMAERIQAHNFQLTTLEPGFFATNFGNYDREGIEQRNVLFMTAGEGRTAYVNPGDIGRVAARVLTESGHVGKTYRLTGPELHTEGEIAEMLSGIRGIPTQYVNASEEEFRAALAGAGAPGFVADYMLPLYTLIREGHVAEVTDTIERITGRKAVGLREQLERDFGG